MRLVRGGNATNAPLHDEEDFFNREDTRINNVESFLVSQGFKQLTLEATIYALFLNNSCQYVGSTLHLHQRLGDHLRSKAFKFNRILIKTVHRDVLLEEENYLIGLLEPPFNTRGTTRKFNKQSKEQIEMEARKLLVQAGLKRRV